MNLEQSLQALAEDDASVRVPPQVDAAVQAAVMAAWDASSKERSDERRREGHGQKRAARHRRTAIAWTIAGALAASLVAIAVIERPGTGNEPRRARQTGEPEPQRVTAAPPAAVNALSAPRSSLLAGVDQPKPAKRILRPVSSPPPASAAYVLVPDGGDVPLTLMRVRMSRSAFSRIGIPIANPDGDGMVDVDVLVGEDGVARSIRRAAAVGWVEAR